MTLVEVEVQPTLAELGVTARREHELVAQSATAMLEHAIRAGRALLRAKEQCLASGHGVWREWLTENFCSSGTAYAYMKVAAYEAHVRELPVVTLSEARDALRGLPPVPSGVDARSIPRDVAAEAVRLHNDEGMALTEVAEALGIRWNTVKAYVNPDFARERRERTARWRRARRALREQEQREATRRAARGAGGGIAKSYSSAERLQDELGQAHREAVDPEAKAALKLAGEYHRKMRDQIVRALGAS